MTLRKGSTGPDVIRLHEQLCRLRFHALTDAADTFGDSTMRRLVEYQRWAGLAVDGVCGPQTASALIADCGAQGEPTLADFRGSLGLVLRFEGHRGEPYWPGGESGVTVDPGVDLGRQPRERLGELYGHLWTPQTLDWLGTAIGLQGAAAERWIAESKAAGQVCLISREAAAEVLPKVAGPGYWRPLTQRFPGLVDGSPASHSVLLSLGYNRGPWNGHLDCLANSIYRGDWTAVADMIEAMGAGQPEGIAGRRRVEAAHLRSST